MFKVRKRHINGLFSILRSPVEGFETMRYHGTGSLTLATALYLLFFAAVVAQRQWTGYLFNDARVEELNIFIMMALSLGLVLLFIISNMAVCTLTDGEGSLSDVYVTTAYAALPFVLSAPAVIIISNLMLPKESAYYNMLLTVQYGWSLVLLFFGNRSAHHFSVKKTFATFFLTVAGMLILLFLLFLTFNLAAQLMEFIRTIYNEISFM